MSTSHEMQIIRRRKLARVASQEFSPIARRPIGGLPLRQYVHSRNKDGGLASTCMKCYSVVGASRDEFSLLASEREHLCREKDFKV
jgi:hypothetical protein